MEVAYMPLFPSLQNIRLADIWFDQLTTLTPFLGACGSPKALSFSNTRIDKQPYDYSDSEWEVIAAGRKLISFDLTGLEALAVIPICAEEEDFIVTLVEHSPPAKLRSLTFESFTYDGQVPCPISTMEKLLQLAAPSLVNLVIDPAWTDSSHENQISELFRRISAFPSLHSLTLWLRPNHQAEELVRALPAAPNLSTIVFRIGFDPDDPDYSVSYGGEDDDRKHLDKILHDAFPWGTSEPLKGLLKPNFPLLQRIGFHFWPGPYVDASDMHFRRGLRRRMERMLKEHLNDVGADVEEYLEIKWLDKNRNPVAYSRTTGKPPWAFINPSWNTEEPRSQTTRRIGRCWPYLDPERQSPAQARVNPVGGAERI
ncbi:hypothetical protein B0H17DRAFT_1196254 [Mycena rosella]|uniref:Uncharacterized protein n=1 Tax=Mycena rosella TaxID=1033263 RepID=A0AAD7GQC1_MYCRO|nr:hypothetical protein B0H17DRAFT_1196254 [Mycena rosella]